MGDHAVLGPVDPQLGEYPAASLIKLVQTKPVEEIDDRTWILADIGKKAIDQLRAQVTTPCGPDDKGKDRRTGQDSFRRPMDARFSN